MGFPRYWWTGFADAAIDRQCRTIEMVFWPSVVWFILLCRRHAVKFGAMDQMGIYMGIFNMFIVIPQIAALVESIG